MYTRYLQSKEGVRKDYTSLLSAIQLDGITHSEEEIKKNTNYRVFHGN